MLRLFHPKLDFRAVTPRFSWEADSAETVIDSVFTKWFGDDEIRSIERLETDSFPDRTRVGYRFALTNADGAHLVEQQAYIGAEDGRITFLRIVCSGKRPVG